MAPREKTTAEQKVHLLARLDDYIESRKHNALTKFWASLFQSWFALWPETEDMSIENAERRKAAHGQAIDQKQEYLKTWYRNRTGPARARTRAPPGQVVVAPAVKPTRCLQPVEVYFKKYYATRVAPFLNTKGMSKGQRLKTIRAVTDAKFGLETPEIKEEVRVAYEAQKKEKEQQRKAGHTQDDPTPESYAAGIKMISAHFNAFTAGTESSGWSFVLLAGGPDPQNGGRIRTAGFHYGTNKHGHNVREHVPEFAAQFVPLFGQYLSTCYTPEECASRGLMPDGDTLRRSTSPQSLASPPRSPLQQTPIIHAPVTAVHLQANPLPSVSSLLHSDIVNDPAAAFPGDSISFDDDFWDTFDPSELMPGLEGLGSGGGNSPYPSLLDELTGPLFLPEAMLNAPTVPFDHAGLSAPQVSASATAGFGAPLPFNTGATMDTAPTLHTPNTSAPFTNLLPGANPAVNTPTVPVANASATNTPAATANAPVATVNVPAATPAATVDAPVVTANAPAATANAPAATVNVPAATPAATVDAPAAIANAPAATPAANPAAHDGPIDSGSDNQVAGPLQPKRRKRTRDEVDLNMIVSGKRIKKLKTRTEVESFTANAKGKENRPPPPAPA
ncbi:hypothetical protein BDN71DRAFT_1512953 [Pleurotus eryngii]|uniref:Uncharacterized protein n=1 Tax=Pleurotus eryngii TaxID=5323 RepID=A0A9P5ZJR8_PLEER|nr:hypothetical protein BDN71DRAFT_1512953 [Pleurotus eryngii]